MPGTVVRDSLAVDLLDDVDLTDEGAAQNGTAWEALWPGLVQFTLEIASVTGSTPTLVIDIQGCETSNFSTADVVTLGTISAGDEADGTVLGLTTYVDSKYVRAVADVSGTTVVYTATLKPVLPHDRRKRAVSPSPTSKALA
jgi:hypothetical protein